MILDLGLIEYEEAYSLQRKMVSKRKLGEINDTIVLCVHPSVFTIGRTGKFENLLSNSAGLNVIRVDRGGDITYHGPGQIVAYPILDLKKLGLNLHSYIRLLELTAISFLDEYGIIGGRKAGLTGVWVGDKKIASIGVSASSWISFHGMSINLNTELEYFAMINPCGIRGCAATSLNQLLNKEVDESQSKNMLVRAFEREFNTWCS